MHTAISNRPRDVNFHLSLYLLTYLCVKAEKALMRPGMCAASSQPSLLNNAFNAICTKISYAGLIISLEEAVFAFFQIL